MILKEDQVLKIFYDVGFRGPALNAAVKICKCESNFNTTAHNLTSNEDSRGLMQINVNAHPKYLNVNLYDPYINAAAALEIFTAAGNNFKDWTCARLLNLENPANILLIAAAAGLAVLAVYLYV